MSTYSGRHGPNVSQYLRELDAISPQDNNEENFNIDADLALFTNTQFFDFDSGQNTDFQAHPAKPEADAAQSSPSGDVSAAASVIGDMPNLDFMQNEFNFPEFNNGYTAPQMNNYADANHNYQPLQPSHAAPQIPHAHAQYHAGAPRAGDKRKSDAMPAPPAQSVNFEDVSRVAAEEDKRRRNTAASARFRIKKKQREQALEKSAKEMADKVNSLEAKVSQLETENKWLKNLLVEKNEGNEDISALWKEFTKQASIKLKPESSTGASSKTEDR